VALAGGDVGDVAGLEHRAVALVGPQQAAPVGDVQDLRDRVAVPVGPRARREEDAVDHEPLVEEHGIGEDVAGERLGAVLGGPALAAANHSHVASWSWIRTPPAMSPIASTTRLEISSP
jgi:hypothetical protein